MIAILVLASFAIVKSYADDSNSFGVRLVPDKMIENSDGILEVYGLHGKHVIPTKTGNVVFSSTDSSVVQIMGTEENDTGFITHVKIRANNPGTANIVIAAPGFSSREFTIKVYGNEVSPTGLVIKATPSVFSVNGPKGGYFSVELVNADNLPTIAQTDVPITIASTNNQIATLSATHLTIKTGHYYVTGQFNVNQMGSTTIIASAPSFQSVSTTVTVNSASSPTIQGYVYPAKINNFATSTAYVVAQLKDASGNEMIATQDIPISIMISNATVTGLVNTSPQGQIISANGQIIIKKGDYEGYASIQVNAGLNGTFNVGLSAPEGYLVSNHTAPSVCASSSGCSTSTSLLSKPVQITTVTSQILGDKSAKLDVLPVIATGKTELVGVMHLEDPYGRPVIASKDLQIEVDSSDSNFLSVSPVHISRGAADALVFGRVGNTAPARSSSMSSLLSLHVITYDDITVPIAINASSTNSLKLVADPVIPKIMSDSKFPMALYLTDSSNALSSFPDSYQTTILPNDYFHVNTRSISSGDSVDLVDAQSIKNGSSTIDIITGSYSARTTLGSVSSSPTNIDLDYPSPLIANSTNLMGVQILDSNSNPRYLDSDVSLKLVSSNDSVIFPKTNLSIPKGSYYAKFYLIPHEPGTTIISLIADNLPLATYKVSVDSMKPSVTLSAPLTVLPGDSFLANLTAKRYDEPVQNLNVAWRAHGAFIQNSDKATNQNGEANVSLMSNSTGKITLEALVSGYGFGPLDIEKTIQINSTQVMPGSSNGTSTQSKMTPNMEKLKIDGIDPLPILVVGAIAAGGILIKKGKIKAFQKSQGDKK